MITTYSILHCMNWALESRSQVRGIHFWLSSILHCMNLYELSPGIQVSSSRCTFLVKFYITMYEPVWTEPWNPGLKFVKIQSKSVHGVCSLHLHVKTNILMIENMLTTCIAMQKPFQTFPAVPDMLCSAHLLTNRTHKGVGIRNVILHRYIKIW